MENGLSKKVAWGLVWTGFVLLVVFLMLLFLSGYIYGPVLNLKRAALVGTFVGGTVGAIWALAGIFFFYSALQLQEQSLDKLSQSLEKQEESLALQREELKCQREEYKLQRKELELTRKVFETQAFETTFFSLITQKDIAEKRSFDHGANEKSCIEFVLSMLKDSFNGETLPASPPSTQEHSYKLVKPFINVIEILLDFTNSNSWGDKIIAGKRDALTTELQNLAKPNLSAFAESCMPNSFHCTPDQIVRDKGAYGSIIAGTTSPEGKVLFFYYVHTCNPAYKELARELGFFDGLPVSAFHKEWNHTLDESTTVKQGLLYSSATVASR